MKKRLFYSVISAIIIFISGATIQSCSDDDDNNTPNPTVGKKEVDIRVIDEHGNLTSANIDIKKDGTLVKTELVAGIYSYDVTNIPSNSVYTFKASRAGYVSSAEKTVTLTYTNSSDTWSSYIVLQITKESQTVTLDPSKDNTIALPSTTDPSKQVSMVLPAGATGNVITELTPTVIMTGAANNELVGDAPNGAPALEIFDLASTWTGPFLNGKKANFTFPLTQSLIDEISAKGIDLAFGTVDNATKTWEYYPVTIDKSTNTGTASIPHFSVWVLTLNVGITFTGSDSEEQTLGTSDCEKGITVTYTQANPPVPEFYKRVLGITALPAVTQTHVQAGAEGTYYVVKGKSQKVTITSTSPAIPTFVFYKHPVTFSATPTACDHHTGGGGS